MNNNPEAVFPQALRNAGIAGEIRQITPLVPEASVRRYYRLVLADPSTLVGVHEDPASAKTTMPLVTGVQSFLAQNHVAVPTIQFSDPDSGIMLQQDLGDLSLNQALKQQPDQADVYYKEAITRMFGWQRLADDGKCPAFKLSFDVEKFMFEFEFFITHTLLGYYQAELSAADLTDLRRDFHQLAETLAAPQRKFFTHRDYHSRNIMLFEDKQYIIDFQDARLGLVQYDLSSLVCDSYAPLTPELRLALVEYAFESGREIHRQTHDEFLHYFDLSAFQRIVKAMGTFGRQAALGRSDFAACLIPARQALAEVSESDSTLRALADCLFDRMALHL